MATKPKKPCKLYRSTKAHKVLSALGYTVRLPPGCFGVQFIFTTKKAAREWEGKDVKLIEIEAKE